MVDSAHALERFPDGFCITNISDYQLDVVAQIRRPLFARAVDLFTEGIQGAHAITSGEKLVGDIRTNEACPAGDQNQLLQRPLPSGLCATRLFTCLRIFVVPP